MFCEIYLYLVIMSDILLIPQDKVFKSQDNPGHITSTLGHICVTQCNDTLVTAKYYCYTLEQHIITPTYIWVKRTRLDILQNSVNFFQLRSLNTPILKQAQTKGNICSTLFCLKESLFGNKQCCVHYGHPGGPGAGGPNKLAQAKSTDLDPWPPAPQGAS